MLYLRIDDRKPMRWTVYTLMAIIIGQALMTTTVMSLSYIVPSQLGDASQGDASNIRIKPVTAQAFWNAADVMSAVTSTAVYVAPFFTLRGLQLPKRQKWGVAVLLGLGILPVAGKQHTSADYEASTYEDRQHPALRPTTSGQCTLAATCTTKSSTPRSGYRSKSTSQSCAAQCRPTGYC